MRKAAGFVLAGVVLVALGGCGAPPRTDFPDALRDANGNVILFDDVLSILNDSNRTDDEKRDALRALGLEDERLIEALIAA